MKRNRLYTRKQSVFATFSVRMLGFIVIGTAVVFLNYWAQSRTNHVLEAVGKKEKQLAELEKNRVAAKSQWDGTANLSTIEGALRSLGMSMTYPKPSQIVKMDAFGKPRPGQHSLAKLTGTRRTERVVRNLPGTSNQRTIAHPERKRR